MINANECLWENRDYIGKPYYLIIFADELMLYKQSHTQISSQVMMAATTIINLYTGHVLKNNRDIFADHLFSTMNISLV